MAGAPGAARAAGNVMATARIAGGALSPGDRRRRPAGRLQRPGDEAGAAGGRRAGGDPDAGAAVRRGALARAAATPPGLAAHHQPLGIGPRLRVQPVVEVVPLHRGRQCAQIARRDDREYREIFEGEARREPARDAGVRRGVDGDAVPAECRQHFHHGRQSRGRRRCHPGGALPGRRRHGVRTDLRPARRARVFARLPDGGRGRGRGPGAGHLLARASQARRLPRRLVARHLALPDGDQPLPRCAAQPAGAHERADLVARRARGDRAGGAVAGWPGAAGGPRAGHPGAAAGLPRGVRASRRRGVGAPGSRSGAGHLRRDLEVAGAQGPDADPGVPAAAAPALPGGAR